MITIVRGTLISLSPAAGLFKARYRSYPYADFKTQDGERLRVVNFKAHGDVDRDLKEGTVGIYIFTKVMGLTNLVAMKTASSERTVPAGQEFGLSWIGVLGAVGIFSILIVTWILIPFVLLFYIPAMIAVHRERPLLFKELAAAGIAVPTRVKTM